MYKNTGIFLLMLMFAVVSFSGAVVAQEGEQAGKTAEESPKAFQVEIEADDSGVEIKAIEVNFTKSANDGLKKVINNFKLFTDEPGVDEEDIANSFELFLDESEEDEGNLQIAAPAAGRSLPPDPKFNICHYPPGNPANPQFLKDKRWTGNGGHVNHTHDFIVESDDENYVCPPIVEEEEDPVAKVIAHKIVCESEEFLPNWGEGGDDINEDTASDFVDASEGSCWFEEGWEFEWTSEDVENPGDDLVGPAGDPWITFGPTDSNGMTMTTFEPSEGKFWFREVLKEGYIPFTWFASGRTVVDDVSAEFYCNTDVLNYDNREAINGLEVDTTYYCVAFNAEKEEEENTSPVITLIGDATVYVTLGESYTDAGATADDNEDGDITVDIVTGGSVDTNTLGSYEITYDVMDSDGASATQVIRTVIVQEPEDTSDPEATPKSNTGGGGRSSSGGRRAPSGGEVLGAFTGDSCGMYLFDYMKIGMNNNPAEVTKLQSFLNEQGIFVPVTGFFGPLTDGAVKAFQGKYDNEILTPWSNLGFGDTFPTGYVFKTTRWKINNVVCLGSEAFPQLP